MSYYRPLVSDNEIRVVTLLTERDHPRYASGPVFCKIEHVLLDRSELTAQDSRKSAVKGSGGTWPPPIVEDIEAQPSRRDGADSNVLWPKTTREWFSDVIRTGLLPSSYTGTREAGCAANDRSTGSLGSEDPDLELPWRYIWGDYVALSYVWGDPTATHDIYVDGTTVAVTENLEAALRQLRSHDRIKQGFKIWIDALCINQENLKERESQVARMNDIYASAWHVVVWLGPEADDSDLAMVAIQYFNLRLREKDPLQGVYRRVDRTVVNCPPVFRWQHKRVSVRMQQAVFRAIYHLLARPYWRRVWILQEVALGARDTPVLCGSRCILLEQIYHALQVMHIDGAEFGKQIIRPVKGRDGMLRSWYCTRGDTYAISEKLWERPIAIVHAQVTLEDPKPVIHGDILSALMLSREANATDERDRIYGILGLPCLVDVVNIMPDYTLTIAQTFTRFSQSLFKTGDLNGLRLVASPISQIGTSYLKFSKFSRPRAPKLIHKHRVINPGCAHGLPSWVICWSCPRNPALYLPNVLSLRTKYTERLLFHHENRLMTVQGVLFDTINTLSAFHATESDRSYPFNGPLRKSIYGDHAATREALWRTLVSNTAVSGTAVAPAIYSSILEPTIWDLGINDIGRKLFGLNDFFARNKSLRIFDHTLEELINGRQVSRLQRVKAWVKLPVFRNDQVQREATLWAMRLLAWRRLVTTEGGYLGLAPAAARAGDVIVVVPGCDVPLVLRQDGEWFRVLGEAHVHGIMEGEVLDMVEHGRKRMVDITLC